MDAPQEPEQDQDQDQDATTTGTGRRGRPRIAVLVVVAALLVAGGVWLLWPGTNGAVEVVRAHVEAVARGDGRAAMASLADDALPRKSDPEQPVRLLAAARERIVVDGVELAPGEDPDMPVLDVLVRYTLDGTRTEALLTAHEEPEGWRIVEPLLVPVRVTTNYVHFPTAVLGGESVEIDEQVLAYPGVYDLVGVESPYLRPETDRAVVTRPSELGVSSAHGSVGIPLDYVVTAELTPVVSGQVDQLLAGCFDPRGDYPTGCPDRVSRRWGDEPRMIRKPDDIRLEFTWFGHIPSGQLHVTAANGLFEYTVGDRTRIKDDFAVQGTVVVTPSGQVEIQFGVLLR